MTIDGFSRDVGSGNQKLQLVAILCNLMWIYWALYGWAAINWNYLFVLLCHLLFASFRENFDFVDDTIYSAP